MKERLYNRLSGLITKGVMDWWGGSMGWSLCWIASLKNQIEEQRI